MQNALIPFITKDIRYIMSCVQDPIKLDMDRNGIVVLFSAMVFT
jgi:hypothetical protein